MKKRIQKLVVLFITLGAMIGMDCPPETTPNGNTNTNGNDNTAGTIPFTVVRTDLAVRHDAAVRTGDDLIAYGTDVLTGVSFIRPSSNPTTGTAVPNSDEFDSSAFDVGETHIFLVGANTGSLAFQVSVLDAETNTIKQTFPTTDIRLGTIPASEEDIGNIRADGDYCVVICDQNTVTDGKIIKVIGASTNPPTLVAFNDNPALSHFNVDQVDVDAATRKAVAVADDTFFIYDIDAPNAAPVEVEAPNGVGDVQIEIAGNYIIAIDNQSPGEAFMVNIAMEVVENLTNPEAALQVAICDDVFAFFADAAIEDRGGGSQRIAVGNMPGPTSAKASLDQFIDGSTVNNGLIGFGGSLCVTPSGDYVFISDGYLQFSTGMAIFTVIPDPDGSDPYGTPAWDVDCSSNTVAFKTATEVAANTTTTVGYIVLP